MNKKEAAERLGVSTRLVEKYAGEGRLGEVKYIRGRTGRQADYDEQAVERLKAELEAPSFPLVPAAQSRETGLVAPQDRERFLAAMEALAGRDKQGHTSRQLSITDLAAKPLLTLAEAHLLTGLSRAVLRDAIDAGKLKAKIIGRAWRIKRVDLDAYIRKL